MAEKLTRRPRMSCLTASLPVAVPGRAADLSFSQLSHDVPQNRKSTRPSSGDEFEHVQIVEHVGTGRNATTPEKDKALTYQGFSDFSDCLRHIKFDLMVEVSGIEPLTSCMPCKRSPS